MKKLLIIISFFVIQYAGIKAQENARVYHLKNRLAMVQVDIPNLSKTVDISVSQAPVNEVLRGVGLSNEVNFDIAPDLTDPVTINMSDVKISDLLVHLAEQNDLDIKVTGNIITIKKFVEKKEKKEKIFYVEYKPSENVLSYELNNDTLFKVFKKITDDSEKNLVFAPGLENKLLNGYINNMSFGDAMSNLAFSNNLLLSEARKDYYLFENGQFLGNQNSSANQQGNQSQQKRPRRNLASEFFYKILDKEQEMLEIDAQNTSIQDIVELIADDLGLSVFYFSPVQGNTDVKVKAIRYDNLVYKILENTPYTFYKENGIYFFGEKKQASQINNEKIRLVYRSVEELTKFIPQQLAGKLGVKEDLELNAIIASGTSNDIERLRRFLQKIDVPIPVVFIEVMIVDITDGYSIETGVTAGIGTRPTTTSGTLYPNQNMNLGARKINKVIAGSSLLENIGNVGANFYLQIKAQESNEKFRVHSTPNLSTLSGHKANLEIGLQTHYANSNSNFYGNENPILNTNIQFEAVEAKLALEILPVVSDDEQITLNIKLERSNFVETPNVKINDSQGRSVEVTPPPDKNFITFNSLIRVANEDVIVLGGLKDKNISDGGTGIPLLSRIPILGWFFSNKKRVKNDRKLILFIKPTILR